MRRAALIVLKFAVSALLLYFATSRIHFGAIGERFNRLNVGWLLVAIAIVLLQTVLGSIRWQRIALYCGAPLHFAQALRLNMIASFFNQVLPSTVGGDAVRILLVARTGVGAWKAAYSVLLDRFFGVLALAALVTAGLYWSFELIQDSAGRLVLLAVGLGSIAGGALFLALGSLPLFSRWRVTRRLADLSLLARQILASRSSGLLIVSLSLFVQFLTAAIAWSAAQSVAAPLGYADSFLLVLPVMLIATVPISIAGWGVRESALVLAFSYAGLPESDGLIISIILGGVMFAVGIIGGVIWLLSPEKSLNITERAAEPSPLA